MAEIEGDPGRKRGDEPVLEHIKAGVDKARPVLALLRKWIRVTFGEDETVLVDFGMTRTKTPRQLTGDEKLAMVTKIKATRAARTWRRRSTSQ